MDPLHPDGRTFNGTVDELSCRRNGGDPGRPHVLFSVAYVDGAGTFDGKPGYLFHVDVHDHGEPGNDDRYRVVITDTDTNEVAYTIGGIVDGGNVQIHPSAQGRP